MNVLKNGLYKQFVCNHAATTTAYMQNDVVSPNRECFSSTYKGVVVSLNRECSSSAYVSRSCGISQ